jgi:hypothetical protein
VLFCVCGCACVELECRHYALTTLYYTSCTAEQISVVAAAVAAPCLQVQEGKSRHSLKQEHSPALHQAELCMLIHILSLASTTTVSCAVSVD